MVQVATRLVRLTAMFALLLMVGCTAMVWEPALQTRAVDPQIAGVVCNYPIEGERAVVITYRALGDWQDVQLAISIDGSNDPIAPFAPAGVAYVMNDRIVPSYLPHDLKPVAGQLSESQLKDVFASSKSTAVYRAMLQAHLKTADWHPALSPPVYYRTTEYPPHPASAYVLAFSIDRANRIANVPIDWQASDLGPIRLPAGTHLLLVPASVDRPRGDQRTSALDAVALTPFTIAGDAITVGVGVPLSIAIWPVYLIAREISPDKPEAAATQPAVRGPIMLQIQIGDQPCRVGVNAHHYDVGRFTVCGGWIHPPYK